MTSQHAAAMSMGSSYGPSTSANTIAHGSGKSNIYGANMSSSH